MRDVCSRRRKDDCMDSDSCYWIVGKGCYRKRYILPEWSQIMSKKYSVHTEDIPLFEGQERAALCDLGLKWLEHKYSNAKKDVCVYAMGEKVSSKFMWVDFSNMSEEDYKDKKIRRVIKLLNGETEKLCIPNGLTDFLQKCLDNKSKIIIIPITYKVIRSDISTPLGNHSSHKNIIIINKFLKTIEFYDPNGNEFHEVLYQNKELPYIKKYLRSFSGLSRYRFVKIRDIWEYGFQYFEAEESLKLNEKGKCMFWSIFLAELRIKYYNIPPKDLMDNLLNKLEEGAEPVELNRFIKEYMTYLVKQITPEHSVHLYSILSKSARGLYKETLKKNKDYKPLILHERRLQYNKLVDMSIKYLESPDVCVPFIPTKGTVTEDVLLWVELRVLPDEYLNELKETKNILMELTNNKGYGLHIPFKIREQILKCLDSETKLIIIPIGYARGKLDPNPTISGHKCLLVINNVLKTIEFYDPNGSQAHDKMFGGFDKKPLERFVKSFPSIRNYTIYGYDFMNYHGFQYYEGMFPKKLLDERAKCAAWVAFIAKVRSKYYHLLPDQLINQIYNKIDEERRPEIFRSFILDYLTYMENKLKSMPGTS